MNKMSCSLIVFSWCLNDREMLLAFSFAARTAEEACSLTFGEREGLSGINTNTWQLILGEIGNHELD